MNIEKKILEELRRFNEINRYIVNEQALGGDVPPPPPAEGGDELGGGATPPPPAEGGGLGAETPPATDGAAPEEVAEPTPVDIANDPDVEEVGAESEGSDEETEEIDITDLVTSQKDIQSKQDEFMDGVFSKLDELEEKLAQMDSIMTKIDSLETKFDKYREKTPEEKLMLRSLDSYPYNQKLTDFFDEKKDEMEETGKNEYVLTSDEVQEFTPNELKKTFNIYGSEDNDNEFKL